MPTRLLNDCLHCDHTWFPRGTDLSSECPNCGAVFAPSRRPTGRPVGRPSDGRQGLLVGLCIGASGAAVLAVVWAGALLGRARDDARARDEARSPEPAPREPARPAKPPPAPDTRSATAGADTLPARDPLSTEPPAAEPERFGPERFVPKRSGAAPQADPFAGAVRPAGGVAEPPPGPEPAPPPRLAADRRRPPFVSEWARCGGSETRVVGVAVERPLLVESGGRQFRGPDPVLLIRLETRRVAGRPVTLRRWIGALSANARLTAGADVPPVRWSSAAVAGQLAGPEQLAVGGTPVTDVLAFAVPRAADGELVLWLYGSHASDDPGIFEHVIPRAAWAGDGKK